MLFVSGLGWDFVMGWRLEENGKILVKMGGEKGDLYRTWERGVMSRDGMIPMGGMEVIVGCKRWCRFVMYIGKPIKRHPETKCHHCSSLLLAC